MLLVISVALVVFLWDDGHRPIPLRLTRRTGTETFLIWLLAFFPGWLFIRFLTSRGPALWDEYVVNLHRLGVDNRKYLPRPLEESEYYRMWRNARRADKWLKDDDDEALRNLYQEKFDAYYGKDVSTVLAGRTDNVVLPTETMFPVILTTALFAVGSAVFMRTYNDGLIGDGIRAPIDILAFVFAGSYIFNLQTLVRRFFQTDLRASAYASAVARVVSSAAIGLALSGVPPLGTMSEGWAHTTAFILGFFPLAGLQALRRIAATSLGLVVRTMHSTHPLGDIQGMNLWYESRLVEEGIEDIQELATANLVEVLLHTRVPVSRLVDWLDQAHLLLYLEPKRQKQKAPEAGENNREKGDQPPRKGDEPLRKALERHGIRRASTFLVAFGAYLPVDAYSVKEATPGNGKACVHTDNRPAIDPAKLAKELAGETAWSEEMILALVRVIANDTAITPILNWRHWGAEQLFKLQRGLPEQDTVDVTPSPPAPASASS